jgi:hypothetical protein
LPGKELLKQGTKPNVDEPADLLSQKSNSDPEMVEANTA